MTFNPATELRETCPTCGGLGTGASWSLCVRCNGAGFVRRHTHDAASGIDGPPEPRHITARMVTLARLLRDDSNSDALRELLELIDGGAA